MLAFSRSVVSGDMQKSASVVREQEVAGGAMDDSVRNTLGTATNKEIIESYNLLDAAHADMESQSVTLGRAMGREPGASTPPRKVQRTPSHQKLGHLNGNGRAYRAWKTLMMGVIQGQTGGWINLKAFAEAQKDSFANGTNPNLLRTISVVASDIADNTPEVTSEAKATMLGPLKRIQGLRNPRYVDEKERQCVDEGTEGEGCANLFKTGLADIFDQGGVKVPAFIIQFADTLWATLDSIWREVGKWLEKGFKALIQFLKERLAPFLGPEGPLATLKTYWHHLGEHMRPMVSKLGDLLRAEKAAFLELDDDVAGLLELEDDMASGSEIVAHAYAVQERNQAGLGHVMGNMEIIGWILVLVSIIVKALAIKALAVPAGIVFVIGILMAFKIPQNMAAEVDRM